MINVPLQNLTSACPAREELPLMPSRNRTRHFDHSKFEAQLIRENADGSGPSIRFLQSEEEELDKLAEDEFRANYQQEYQKACAQAEEEWYPYRAGGFSTVNRSKCMKILKSTAS